MSADLQVGARLLHDDGRREGAPRDGEGARPRARPFLRRQIAARVRLRRVPELHFTFDESVDRGQRIEQLLQEIQARPAPRR